MKQPIHIYSVAHASDYIIYTVGLINIATKTPAPVPLGEGLSIVSSKEWWNPVELELEFWLQYL